MAIAMMMLLLAAPPASDATLNELLAEIHQLQSKGVVAPSPVLDAETRGKLRLRPAKAIEANPATLADDSIKWTVALGNLLPTEPVADARRRAEKYWKRGKAAIATGPVDASDQEQFDRALEELDRWLTKRVADIGGGDYAAAKRQLKLLNGASVLFKQPDAGDYLPKGSKAARGDDIATLTKNMSDLQQRFAAPGPGDEKAYDAIRAKLAEYLNALRVAAPR